ncbi:MAG: hypothetical protein TU36_005110 [Vulcanisaeta sp. AZ3]
MILLIRIREIVNSSRSINTSSMMKYANLYRYTAVSSSIVLLLRA